MKPKLSIIVPGIRVVNWEGVYNSICNSITYPFEMIIVSPYALPTTLQAKTNVKYVKDFGSPVRCSNIGLELCEGELMSWNADDGEFLLNGCIDRAINAFDSMPANDKNVLACKYQEAQRITQPDSYFKLCNAYPRVINTKDDWWIFNLVITKTRYFQELGGWDCEFETLAVAHADMAVRAYQDGCIVEMFHEPIVFNQHGHSDHVPVERGHAGHDEPLYKTIHNNPESINRISLDMQNWKQAPAVWARRFG